MPFVLKICVAIVAGVIFYGWLITKAIDLRLAKVKAETAPLLSSGQYYSHYRPEPLSSSVAHPVHWRLRFQPDFIFSKALEVQSKHWRTNFDMKAYFLNKGIQNLEWSELFLLHQYLCSELLSIGPGRAQVMDGSLANNACPEGERKELLLKICQKLCSPESPYRPCEGTLHFKGIARPALSGLLKNASSTHLGTIELIRLTKDGYPDSLTFTCFEEIQSIQFLTDGAYRLTKVAFRDEEKEEYFLAPTLYGLSLLSPHVFDQDASTSRYLCALQVEGTSLSIALGQQEILALGNIIPKGFQSIQSIDFGGC